jgi:nucleoside-diphosphate-sugar epimerase
MAKIAITGHSAGIGQALSKIYESQGHEVIGLSRRNGFNIRNTLKIVELVKPCDMFINNAQVGFAQTEILYAVYEEWKGVPNKKIINISTMMTLEPTSPIKGYDMIQYYTQKIALEEAHKQLLHLHNWPKLCLVKPGAVATQPNQTSPKPYANVDTWARALVTILDQGDDLEVSEISLGVNHS